MILKNVMSYQVIYHHRYLFIYKHVTSALQLPFTPTNYTLFYYLNIPKIIKAHITNSLERLSSNGKNPEEILMFVVGLYGTLKKKL